MTQVKPFIKCVDYWPEQIPPDKLAVYKQFIEEGQILKHHVIYGKKDRSTTVEYYAIAPHEWMLEEMARRCSSEHKAES